MPAKSPKREKLNEVPAHHQPPPQSFYKPEYAVKAKELAANGATIGDLAAFFRVTSRTIHNWAGQYPDFDKAIQAGNEIFNPRIERAMAETAPGHMESWEEEIKVNGKVVGTIVRQQYIPPNASMQRFWATNRMKDRWAEKQQVELSGKLQSSEELTQILNRQILDLQEQGYLKVQALPEPEDDSEAE